MIAQLQEVIAKIEQLPEEEQVGLAYRIALDIESLDKPDVVTAPPGSLIDQLIAEAKEEHRLGLTRPLEDICGGLTADSSLCLSQWKGHEQL